MGVVFECKAEVSDVLCGVFGLLHGAQGDLFDDVLLFLSFDVAQQVVERRCCVAASGAAHLVAELGNETREDCELLEVGLVVDAVDKGLWGVVGCLFAYCLGYGAVGEQHELLNELVRLVALGEVDR